MGLQNGADALPYPLARDDAGRASTVAFFHEDYELNERWSEENGRPIYNRVIVVTIKARGQKSSEAAYRLCVMTPDDEPGKPQDPKKPTRKFYKNILDRPGVADAFEAWESKQQVAAHGTPLESWPIVNRAQVQTLKHVNVFTVEDLAELPDGALPNTGLGLTAREIRAKAQAFLSAATDAAAVTKLAARLERLEEASKAKDDELKELRRENAALRKGKPARAPSKQAHAPAARAKSAGAARATSKPFKAERPRRPADPDADLAHDLAGAEAELGAGEDGEDGDFI